MAFFVITEKPDDQKRKHNEVSHSACIRHPDNFLGIAGRKLFRDEVWGRYRFVFQADHRYYKRRGFYDFPQKNWRMRLHNAWLTLRLKVPKTRRQIRNSLPGFMVKPFLDELDKQ